MESSHTQRGRKRERECGGASKQKLNFVSRLKLKIAFVVRVNSEGSPEGRAVAPQKWWQASKPDCCCHVLLYCCRCRCCCCWCWCGIAGRTIKYERTTTKKYKLNPNWSWPQNGKDHKIITTTMWGGVGKQLGSDANGGVRECGRGGAANKSRLQISSANLFCSRALWRAWGTIMEARQELEQGQSQGQLFSLPSPPAYPCR